MIQRGNCVRLALEAFAELRGGNFDRDVPIRTRVLARYTSPMPPLPMSARIS